MVGIFPLHKGAVVGRVHTKCGTVSGAASGGYRIAFERSQVMSSKFMVRQNAGTTECCAADTRFA